MRQCPIFQRAATAPAKDSAISDRCFRFSIIWRSNNTDPHTIEYGLVIRGHRHLVVLNVHAHTVKNVLAKDTVEVCNFGNLLLYAVDRLGYTPKSAICELNGQATVVLGVLEIEHYVAEVLRGFVSLHVWELYAFYLELDNVVGGGD